MGAQILKSQNSYRSTGETLRDARQRAGVSVVELAERIDVTANTIYRWENDAVEPSISTLRQVAEALGMKLSLNIE